MLPDDQIDPDRKDEVVDNVRATVGEKAVDLTATYFEDEYRAKQRETTLKAFGGGVLLGVAASAAAVLFRHRR